MTDPDIPAVTSQKPERFNLLESLRGLFKLESSSIRHDIEDALATQETAAEFSQQERLILKNVLGLRDLRVVDVMVPRPDIVAVSTQAPLLEVLTVFRTAGHSRLPVYSETLDDPRGMIHIRDFMNHISSLAEGGMPSEEATHTPFAKGVDIDLSISLWESKIIRPVLFAPPSMPALDLLLRMQATRTHMALVIDEYGGTDGLVSIEDIVEMIVGDIEDEHDVDEMPMIEEKDGQFIVDARASLEDVEQATGWDFRGISEEEDVHTLGGFVIALTGRVPVRGEMVAPPGGGDLEILDADPRRVKRVRLSRKEKTT